jgi:hypothetical protein
VLQREKWFCVGTEKAGSQTLVPRSQYRSYSLTILHDSTSIRPQDPPCSACHFLVTGIVICAMLWSRTSSQSSRLGAPRSIPLVFFRPPSQYLPHHPRTFSCQYNHDTALTSDNFVWLLADLSHCWSPRLHLGLCLQCRMRLPHAFV